MPIYEFEGRCPVIAADAYVSETAIVIGDVRIAPQVYIGHGVILRADYGTIVVEEQTAVEEGAIIHINPGATCLLERRVTIGHGAKIHCPFIGTGAVIGIGAILSFQVTVQAGAIVAEGAVVPNGKTIPAHTIVAGNPARVLGPVEERHRTFWEYGKDLYVDLAKRYPGGLRRLS
ncbi:MAG: gamma carbonic anhydrase family protein [Deltaproteobacteria bacterium]|nr:gamma carbonic anhydrase family protein [Candidatus Anaeroferrophillus wilburensis]MBN2889325.1 gamma carbonic anhydrase family protein [Deltaproteobacteria bacterium]